MIDKERLQQEIDAAEAVHDAEEAAEARGEVLPPYDPARISMPNFADSRVISVRVIDRDHEALVTMAENSGGHVADIVHAAIHRYVNQPNSGA